MQTTRGQSEITISRPIIDCVSEPVNVYRNHYFQISAIVITLLFLKRQNKNKRKINYKESKGWCIVKIITHQLCQVVQDTIVISFCLPADMHLIHQNMEILFLFKHSVIKNDRHFQ